LNTSDFEKMRIGGAALKLCVKAPVSITHFSPRYMESLYWITGSGPLHLAIMPRPRGGELLQADLRALQAESVDILVSLLTPGEIVSCELTQEPDLCRNHGIDYRSFPIADHSVPTSDTSVLDFASKLELEFKAGKAIVLHCYAGIGRSSLMAACILVIHGKSAIAAFNQIREIRGCHVPETAAQFAWVESFALRLAQSEL
jgi:hypothetical protein